MTCSAAPNAATCSTAGQRPQARRQRGELGPVDGPRDERLARDDLARRALRQQPAVEDVAELVAALGLVHVVRADQHRDAARGELVQLVPEIAPRLRIDAGGRLVEQQQLRLVQQARGERQALLPAAGQLAGELVARDRRGRAARAPPRRACAPSSIAVHARDEAQVLADRQVLPEREALRHVADVALDRLGLAPDVEAEARALAAVGRQQPAEHPDRRGLAAAVGPEEAEDLAAAHRQREILDDVMAAEALVEAAHVDDDVVGHGRSRAHDAGSVTSTGWPGCSFAASAGAGFASTR